MWWHMWHMWYSRIHQVFYWNISWIFIKTFNVLLNPDWLAVSRHFHAKLDPVSPTFPSEHFWLISHTWSFLSVFLCALQHLLPGILLCAACRTRYDVSNGMCNCVCFRPTNDRLLFAIKKNHLFSKVTEHPDHKITSICFLMCFLENSLP